MKRVIFFLLIFLPQSLFAASNSTTFLVTAQVISGCIIAATPMAFGVVNEATVTNATCTVTPTCTLGTPYTVGLNQGTGTGGNASNPRYMTGVLGSLLGYGLFKDNAHTQVWGNSGSALVSGTGTGLPVVLTAYGQIPAGEAVTIDTYTDTITATVSF